MIDYIEADARESRVALGGAARTLDLDQPAAVIPGALEHEESITVVRESMGAVPAGSHPVFADGSGTSPEMR